MASFHFESSRHITAQLAALIVTQEQCYDVSTINTKWTKSKTKTKKEGIQKKITKREATNEIINIHKTIHWIASAKKPSSWLTVNPIQQHGFYLWKTIFKMHLPTVWMASNWVTFDMRIWPWFYHWPCNDLQRGVYIVWHDEVQNITADFLKEVRNDVTMERLLRILKNGEHFQQQTAHNSNCARANISAKGVWRNGERAIVDIRVFIQTSSPIASTLLLDQSTQCTKMRRSENT